MAATDAELKADDAAPTTAEWTIIRCPKDGQRLFDASGIGIGAVRYKCPRCRSVWTYDLHGGGITLEPDTNRTVATFACLA